MSSNTENNNTEIADESAAEQEHLVQDEVQNQESADNDQSASSDVELDNSAESDVAGESEALAESESETEPDTAALTQLAAELAAEGEAEEPATDGPHLTIVPVEALSSEQVRSVIEAALLAADETLTIDRLCKLFVAGELTEDGGRAQVRAALAELEEACEGRGFELKKVASGYRMQVRQSLSPWVSRLWEEKPPRYTRALLETMALIAYKQPATRGDIEEVRGVSVSSNIMRTLLERGWIREVGQRDVPGRPSMYGTTKEFLDYFNLSSLDQLPSLPEIRELVEPAQIPDEPVVALVDDAEEQGADEVESLDSVAQDEASPLVDGSSGDELQGVEMPDSNDGYTTSSAPVFADNEVLVVSESASVEVQQSSDLTTLPAADRQE